MPAAGSRFRPRTLTGRLLVWHMAMVLGVLVILGIVIDRVLESHFVDQLTDALTADARPVQTQIRGAASPQPVARSLAPPLGVGITIVRRDGVVVADSEVDPATMQTISTAPRFRRP